MKAIKITETNAEAINAAIAEVEGRATSRTCNFDDCSRAAMLAEKHAALQLLPKKDHVGTCASYQPAEQLQVQRRSNQPSH